MSMIKKYLKKGIYLQSKERNNNMIMEHQKTVNLLDNAPNLPSKFTTKNCV